MNDKMTYHSRKDQEVRLEELYVAIIKSKLDSIKN